MKQPLLLKIEPCDMKKYVREKLRGLELRQRARAARRVRVNAAQRRRKGR